MVRGCGQVRRRMDERAVLSAQDWRRLAGLALGRPPTPARVASLVERVRTKSVDRALADAKLAARLRDRRHRVIGADLRIDKPARPRAQPRLLGEVGIYDYEDDVLLVAFVDTKNGRVVEVEERPGIQLEPTDDEVEEAVDIALAADRALARRRSLDVVAHPAHLVGIPATLHRHRLVQLYFWAGRRRPEQVGEAIVDLSARSVVERVEELE
jgi:hypothetical protein